MNTNPYDRYLAEKPTDVAQRVALLLESIGNSVERQSREGVNEANIRHMEEFLSYIKGRFPTYPFKTEIQRIPKKRVRTTDLNFIVTVPGKTRETLVFVAHYDTWALTRDAPGADDNTSGEEVLKQYLLGDLSAPMCICFPGPKNVGPGVLFHNLDWSCV